MSKVQDSPSLHAVFVSLVSPLTTLLCELKIREPCSLNGFVFFAEQLKKELIEFINNVMDKVHKANPIPS